MKASTKSVIIFMVVYLGSLSILATWVGYLNYIDRKNALIEKMHLEMRYKARSINAQLEYYHMNKSEQFTFYEEGYDIALYDNKRELLASTFMDDIDFSKLFYADDDEYYLVETLYKEYLDVKYIVIKKPLDIQQLNEILEEITLIAFYGFIFILFVALLLAKIMLSPIKRSIASLTKFMKDATHEMNTPISTILMSYEHMDKHNLDAKQIRSLDRIDIATKTLSSLYRDLSFASFHDYIEYEDTPIDVKEVILERIKYMDTLIQFKGLKVSTALQPKTIYMDQRKLILLIDNLLSNAIKFSKKNGEIEVSLTENYFSVKDNGIGISKEDQKSIFDRFKSTNSLHGGFGVGLDIVNQICKEYHIKIELESEPKKGSTFRLVWPEQKFNK
ncbi:HAMP domain-containing sensor histidine kinase [Sulfurovum sp. AR]|uniref:sensor histidine kinase n=1 Tax=Sulfurovum sp. AR TaxID=1165841 RepID=UPI00025C4B05|nr:HAMP domain-containing sensor histidine kinase [Sulfurovum sp. AR]EIF51263.1 integral membrane sensor signal transduction histidine kinase [Sulfurovum sp. AR]